MKGQVDLWSEIIVDNFAGGGGASTGIELATGRVVDIAINHDPAAILMHQTNHPFTEHIQASVWDVDPVKVCRGRPVGLAWFSPDCKHFSKAKGAALVDRNIRGLAWIVLRWAARVRPRVIILENVEEFQTWGPVRRGRPIKSKAGVTFARWLGQLRDLGYEVEFRELVAADYGAPTIRKRFFLVARCDGQPINWPERTHAPRDSEEVRSGACKPWRSAAEIIDWSLPMFSIFDTKKQIREQYGVNAVRPLAENTMRRIIRGVDKFTIKSGKPFIVQGKFQNGPQSIDNPMTTITSVGAHEVIKPVFAPVVFPNTTDSIGTPAEEPAHTITTACNQIIAAANLMSIGQTGGGNRIRDIQQPAPTTVSKQEACLVTANLIQYHTEKAEMARAQALRGPLSTVDGSNRYGLVTANLVEYFSTGRPLDVNEPLHTVTGRDREALTVPILQPVHAGGYHGKGNTPEAPTNTITGAGGIQLCAAHIAEFKGADKGQDPGTPLRTITASAGEFGVCRTVLSAYEGETELGRWPEVRELLNRHCGYSLGDHEIILLILGGTAWFIRDILLRMLAPRELYSAMGFPADYIIDRDYTGRPYKKAAQVARCGNAVCPPMAEAVVRANFVACPVTIVNMKQLQAMVSA